MSATISAVPLVSSDGQLAPVTGAQSEQPLSEFAAQMQDGALSGTQQAANPAALAAELFGTLRSYFEHARRVEKGISPDWDANDDGGVDVAINTASASPSGEATLALHGGPARERLEPFDSESEVSPGVAVDLAQLQRTMDVALASMNFATETALVVRGTSQISHSANTLLKGQ